VRRGVVRRLMSPSDTQPLEMTMSNSNNTLNASASFFGIGGTITMRVDMSALPINDRLSMLHNLMASTGTTEAIGKMANADEIFKAIDAAWKLAK